MGHVDERDPDLALNTFELELHGVAQLEIQCTQWFVEQQCARIVHQRAGQRNPLLLSAGQLGGFTFGEITKSHDPEEIVDAFAHRTFSVPPVQFRAAGPVGDVVPHSHVGKERVLLKDRVDIALVRRGSGDIGTLKADSALGRSLETGNHPQCGGLAAPGRTEQREELPRGNREVGVGDGEVTAEPFRDVVDLNDGTAPRGVTPRAPACRLACSGGLCAGQRKSSSPSSHFSCG